MSGSSAKCSSPILVSVLKSASSVPIGHDDLAGTATGWRLRLEKMAPSSLAVASFEFRSHPPLLPSHLMRWPIKAVSPAAREPPPLKSHFNIGRLSQAFKVTQGHPNSPWAPGQGAPCSQPRPLFCLFPSTHHLNLTDQPLPWGSVPARTAQGSVTHQCDPRSVP